MVEEEEEDVREEEIIEYKGKMEEKGVAFSVHSLTGELLQSTIRMIGVIKGKEVSILLHGGSSHTLVKPTAIEHCYYLVQPVESFHVKVASGELLECNSWIPELAWGMQSYSFTHSVFVMAAETYDMVLGVDWMRRYSPITIDFKALQSSFDFKGQTVKLQGGRGRSIQLKERKELQADSNSRARQLPQQTFSLQVPNSKEVTNDLSELINTLVTEYKDVFGEP